VAFGTWLVSKIFSVTSLKLWQCSLDTPARSQIRPGGRPTPIIQRSGPLLPIPIVIVTFRNSDDVIECLESLCKSNPDPAFDLYLCENGGNEAFAVLCSRLAVAGGPCVPIATPAPCRTDGFTAVESFKLLGVNARVFAGNAGDNLGYGGGVNRWLGPLREAGDWQGALLLNPDTTVEPEALGALVRYSETYRKGMVTGRIVLAADPTRIHTRGLRWRRLGASPAAVGRNEPTSSRPESVERELDAPSGAFVYVNRACLEEIGLMEERYFLYCEDLEWGLRAKLTDNIGYALNAVVYHKGGTTIGSGSVLNASEFATYLSFRNRLLFVYSHFPAWVAWTTVMSLVRALEFGVRGRPANMSAAVRGTFDGLLGRDGRPDDELNRHLIGKGGE
jgi:N-acetylglucosaminyl-diphospho-decaprenol L-rhamnosyltransferase